jgi:hypothetical protein
MDPGKLLFRGYNEYVMCLDALSCFLEVSPIDGEQKLLALVDECRKDKHQGMHWKKELQAVLENLKDPAASAAHLLWFLLHPWGIRPPAFHPLSLSTMETKETTNTPAVQVAPPNPVFGGEHVSVPPMGRAARKFDVAASSLDDFAYALQLALRYNHSSNMCVLGPMAWKMWNACHKSKRRKAWLAFHMRPTGVNPVVWRPVHALAWAIQYDRTSYAVVEFYNHEVTIFTNQTRLLDQTAMVVRDILGVSLTGEPPAIIQRFQYHNVQLTADTTKRLLFLCATRNGDLSMIAHPIENIDTWPENPKSFSLALQAASSVLILPALSATIEMPVPTNDNDAVAFDGGLILKRAKIPIAHVAYVTVQPGVSECLLQSLSELCRAYSVENGELLVHGTSKEDAIATARALIRFFGKFASSFIVSEYPAMIQPSLLNSVKIILDKIKDVAAASKAGTPADFKKGAADLESELKGVGSKDMDTLRKNLAVDLGVLKNALQSVRGNVITEDEFELFTQLKRLTQISEERQDRTKMLTTLLDGALEKKRKKTMNVNDYIANWKELAKEMFDVLEEDKPRLWLLSSLILVAIHKDYKEKYIYKFPDDFKERPTDISNTTKKAIETSVNAVLKRVSPELVPTKIKKVRAPKPKKQKT